MAVNPIKILIYEPYIFKVYGNTRYLISIFKFVNRTLFEPILVAPVEDPFLDIIRNFGGRCIILPPPQRLKRYGRTILGDGLYGKFLTSTSIAWHSRNLASFILKEHIDIVQCHSIRALLTIGLAIKLTRRPCFWYIKGDLENPFLDRLGYAIADRILFLCNTMKHRKYPNIVQRYEEKISVLNYGIDLDEVISAERSNHRQFVQQELCINERNFNIICLAQISPMKGTKYLLEAMVKIRQTIPNAVLYLVGDHGIEAYRSYKGTLERIIESTGLDRAVIFTGWRRDAHEIHSLMDLSVLPSLSEGVPTTIIEAMALGKPAVATRVGGVTELVRQGETGFVVEPRDPDGLAHAITTIAKDKELRLRFGENARRIAFEEYDIRNNIAGLEKLYMELVGGTL